MLGVSTSQDRLLHEQMRLLARNVPALVVGTLMLSIGTAVLLLLNGQPSLWVACWLSAMWALCALRWWSARRYWRSPPDPAQAPRWARWFILASFAAGLLWGSLSALFFSPDDPHTQAVVAMILAAIVASETQSLGPYFPAHLAFSVPALVPFALRSIFSGDTRTMTLGLLALVFLLMAELFARRIASHRPSKRHFACVLRMRRWWPNSRWPETRPKPPARPRHDFWRLQATTFVNRSTP